MNMFKAKHYSFVSKLLIENQSTFYEGFSLNYLQICFIFMQQLIKLQARTGDTTIILYFSRSFDSFSVECSWKNVLIFFTKKKGLLNLTFTLFYCTWISSAQRRTSISLQTSKRLVTYLFLYGLFHSHLWEQKYSCCKLAGASLKIIAFFYLSRTLAYYTIMDIIVSLRGGKYTNTGFQVIVGDKYIHTHTDTRIVYF